MRAWFMVIAVAACGTNHPDAGPDSGGTGDSGGDVDAVCGGTHIDLSYVAPNLLLVLDRSCSMTKTLTGSTTTKWEAAVGALTNVLGTYATQIRWGATLFPDTTGDRCTQDAIPVPVADNNASTISTLLTAALDPADPLYPDFPCTTNIDTGLQQAATDPSLLDPARKSYLMLVTDGAQSSGCEAGGGNAGSLATVTDLYQNSHVPTFVVGFGSSVNASFLGQLAVAGGVPRTGMPAYYQADTAADLDQAFATISSLVVSCTYRLDPPPADISLLWIIFDKTTIVPHDPTSGWDYDAPTQTLTLYGSSCDALKTHAVTQVDVVYGCPTPPVL